MSVRSGYIGMLLLASCADNHSPVAGTFVAAYPISSEAEHGPRPATLVGGYTESCPFPKEADFANIDDGTAYLQIVVAADGTAKTVSILRDSGYGFGAAAQACAYSLKYR